MPGLNHLKEQIIDAAYLARGEMEKLVSSTRADHEGALTVKQIDGIEQRTHDAVAEAANASRIIARERE